MDDDIFFPKSKHRCGQFGRAQPRIAVTIGKGIRKSEPTETGRKFYGGV
jgi:hypothetical protein